MWKSLVSSDCDLTGGRGVGAIGVAAESVFASDGTVRGERDSIGFETILQLNSTFETKIIYNLDNHHD